MYRWTRTACWWPEHRENRLQYAPGAGDRLHLGLSPTELTEVGTLAKNVFDVQQATVDPSAAPSLCARLRDAERFNRTMSQLLDGAAKCC